MVVDRVGLRGVRSSVKTAVGAAALIVVSALPWGDLPPPMMTQAMLDQGYQADCEGRARVYPAVSHGDDELEWLDLFEMPPFQPQRLLSVVGDSTPRARGVSLEVEQIRLGDTDWSKFKQWAVALGALTAKSEPSFQHDGTFVVVSLRIDGVRRQFCPSMRYQDVRDLVRCVEEVAFDARGISAGERFTVPRWPPTRPALCGLFAVDVP